MGEIVDGRIETQNGEDPSVEQEALFRTLLSQHQTDLLQPVAARLLAYYYLIGQLKKAENEPWFTSIEGPITHFKQASVSVWMHCRQDIQIRLWAMGTDILTFHCQVWLGSSGRSGFGDTIYVELGDVRYVVNSIFNALQRQPLSDKEAVEIGQKALQVKEDISTRFEVVKSCLVVAFHANDLNIDITGPHFSFEDGLLKLSASISAFQEKTLDQATAYTDLDVTVYADGHVRFEHDRRDVASPTEAAKILKAALVEGRGTPGFT